MSKGCLALILWMAAAVVVDAAPLPGFVLAAQTQHFSFYTRGGEKVDPERVEKRATELMAVLGQDLPAHASYYRYASAQDVAAGTGHYAAGVTLPGEIHSTRPCHDHELVHLLAAQLGGDPGAFFQEGLAVAVGTNGRWQGRPVDKLARTDGRSVADVMRRFQTEGDDLAYASAGSFVGYLVRTHGIRKVTEFFRSCTPGADRDARFASAFGATIEAVAADWRKSL